MAGAPPIALVSGKDVLQGVGGHETYVRAHALAAQRLGLDPHIFCVGPRSRTVATDYGTVHHVRAPGPASMQGPPLANAVAELAGPDHLLGIHGFALWASAGAMAGRLVRRRGFRAAVLCNAYATRAYEVAAMQDGLGAHHGSINRIRYRAWLAWIRAADNRLERWGYANSQLVLVNYASVERILRDAYGDGLNIRRTPYATTDAFADAPPPPRRPNDPPVVACVSRQDPRKGVDVLIRALGALSDAGVPFKAHLAGSGRLLEPHRALARDFSQIELPGRVEDVRPLFAESDIYVLPSLAEASGSVSVLEALRAGTPVISTRIDGMPEDLTDGDDALLVDPNDAEGLASALRRLLTDRELRERLAAGARQTHETRFSAERFVTALGSIYTELEIPVAGLDSDPTIQ
ncbi:MAG: glycosyltransferase family 4 protein [Thermoleophilaceae bacterium]|nr:glycosyltransferase family 4 protein [Thermoleophilaceae bacterium]